MWNLSLDVYENIDSIIINNSKLKILSNDVKGNSSDVFLSGQESTRQRPTYLICCMRHKRGVKIGS